MTIDYDKQIRGWACDYALRVPRPTPVSTKQIIAYAKKFEQFVNGKPRAQVIKMAKQKAE